MNPQGHTYKALFWQESIFWFLHNLIAPKIMLLALNITAIYTRFYLKSIRNKSKYILILDINLDKNIHNV